jgi:hypothetical protein
MARAATDLMRDHQCSLLLNAAWRTFVFARLLGDSRSLRYDADLLYIGALFLRIGVTRLYGRSQQRFEIDSAEAAALFLRGHGRSWEDIAQVWDAIALHTTPGIAQHKPPLTALLCAGVETDLTGAHCHCFSRCAQAAVLAAYPREPGFKFKFLHVMAQGQLHRPLSTVGTPNADVLAFHGHRLNAGGFCALLLASTWPY